MVTSEPGLMLKGVALVFLAAIVVGLFSFVVRFRHRPGLLALIFAVPLAVVALYFVRAVPEPTATPATEVRLADAVDDFDRWQQMEVLGANSQPKPWVTNERSSGWPVLESGEDLKTRSPGAKTELAGYSALEATPQAAIEGARRSAAERLKVLVRNELSRRRAPQTQAQERPIEEAVGRFLADPRAEVDRYEESVVLPASRATAHRAAVLVRVPGSWVAGAADRAVEADRETGIAQQQDRRSLGWTFLSAVALALVIYCIYSFLNAGSKGHLAWPLRIASVAAYLLLCLGLLLLQGRFP